MIQRVQTVYLLLAIVLLVVFSFIPFGYCHIVDSAAATVGVESLTAPEYIGLILPLAAAVLFGAVAVFCFKKLSVQKLFSCLGAVFTLVSIGVVIYILVSGMVDVNPTVTIDKISWGGGGLLLVAALIAYVCAHRSIAADQKLLRSYDRLR